MKRLCHCRRNKRGGGRNGRWRQPAVLSREKEAISVGGRKTLGTIRRLGLGNNACFVQSGPVPIKSKNGDHPLT